MSPLVSSLISASIISLLAFMGLITLALTEKVLHKILIFLVSFSAGSLIGGAFFHLLPESLATNQNTIIVFIYVLIGFGLFFILERFFRWHHCHDNECHKYKHLGSLNLMGDGIHNILDGLIIISTFSVNPYLGISVTLSIIFHEVPQEIGDFGILLYSGFKKKKAIIYNFGVALLTVVGVLVGYFVLKHVHSITEFLLPFAAGTFLYIAASDLVPEIHKEENLKKSLLSFIVFFIALVLMLFLAIK